MLAAPALPQIPVAEILVRKVRHDSARVVTPSLRGQNWSTWKPALFLFCRNKLDGVFLMTENMNRNFGRYFSENVNSFNLSINSNNSITNFTTAAEERSQILESISPLESWRRHHDISTTRVKGVGDWVLGTPEYQMWLYRRNLGSAYKTLFCQGIPGAGKTFVWYSLPSIPTATVTNRMPP